MDKLIRRQSESHRLISKFLDHTQRYAKDGFTLTYLRHRLALIDRYWNAFESLHTEIVQTDNWLTTEYCTSDQYHQTDECYSIIRSLIQEEIDKRANEPVAAANNPANPGTSSETAEPTTASLIEQILVPKAELPKFSGQQRDWESYRVLYVALVHDKIGIAASHKLQLLRASLTGKALSCIVGFESTAAGYQSAWEALTANYDDPEEILLFHINSILRLLKLTKPLATAIKRMISTVKQAIRACQNLKRPVAQWDDWLVCVLRERLDPVSKMLWVSSRKTKGEFATFEQMLTFLQTRSRSLAAVVTDDSANTHSTVSTKSKVRTCTTAIEKRDQTSASSVSACIVCKETHPLAYCQRFRKWTSTRRREFVPKHRLCFNCLKTGHMVSSCPSQRRCVHCQGKHHTLLHQEKSSQGTNVVKPSQSGTESNAESTISPNPVANNIVALPTAARNPVLLATARVWLENTSGHRISIRALLDSGSEATFVTERVIQQLKLPQRKVHVPITGLQGTHTGNAANEVSVILRSHDLSIRRALSRILVLPSLTTLAPTVPNTTSWPHLDGLSLADPGLVRHSPIDMIIGADLYGSLLRDGTVHGPASTPSAQLTALGWVLIGSISPASVRQRQSVSVHTVTLETLGKMLEKFWEQNEVASQHIPTPDDAYCESLFQITHGRDDSGRYSVRLPIKEGFLTKLGDSYNSAVQQLISLERRLSKNDALREKYIQFLSDYLNQGHMKSASISNKSTPSFYLLHHAVTKASDPHGKIRVVFNASAPTTSGYSLNDCMLPGPKLHEDLWLVLSRWRLYSFAFTSDVVQMFRQIRVHEQDQNLTRILWRLDPSLSVQEFCLTTVTYGTVSAPYLAIRVLLQLAQDGENTYPLGAAAIRRHTYVDDILAGGETLNQAMEVKQQLVALLRSGGFSLSKWAANHDKLCPADEVSDRLFSDPQGIPTLGLLWSAKEDVFRLRVVSDCITNKCTKRTILSEVARFYDPLGWASPVLIFGKILLQELWKAKLSWDERLPSNLQEQWKEFAEVLGELNKVTVPRPVQYSSQNRQTHLIGFSDASQRAFAAAVYLRCVTGTSISVNLLVAKTKIAPIATTSMPRLELCGALLLSRLMKATASGIGLPTEDWLFWTDARVVLNWIRSHPSKWTPYVAHRVAAIHEIVDAKCWHYVNTQYNPADLSTRGIAPRELIKSQLWWHGPSWLTQPVSDWPKEPSPSSHSDYLEENTVHSLVCNAERAENEILSRFSNFTRLIRITALCLRFLHNLRNKENKRVGFLTTAELNSAKQLWVLLAQIQDFTPERNALKQHQSLPSRSRLLPLKPIYTEDGLLRVGGIINFSQLPADSKHPPILAKDNHLSLLLTRHAHEVSLHGGPQLMRSLLMNYWIINGGMLAKTVSRNCVNVLGIEATPQPRKWDCFHLNVCVRQGPFTHQGEILLVRSE